MKSTHPIIRKILLAIIAYSVLPVTATEIDLTKTAVPVEWKWSVSNNGTLLIQVEATKYNINTNFSYPHMPANGWITFPDNANLTGQSCTTTTLVFKNDFYQVCRTITQNEYRLEIADTMENLTNDDLAIAFDNIITAENPDSNEKIYVSGVTGNEIHSCPESPSSNSTMFFSQEHNGLGIVMVDDFYRLQATMKKNSHQTILENRSFGLPSKTSYTFQWTLYPMSSNDYYHFINTVRRDWKVNTELRGNILLASCPHKELGDITTPIELFKSYYDKLGVRYVSTTNFTWLGSTSFYSIPGTKRFMESYGSLERYLATLKRGKANAEKIAPDLKSFAKIQTVFCSPPQLPEQAVPFEDSAIVNADGTYMHKRVTSESGQWLGSFYYHYPALDNSYYRHLVQLIDQSLGQGLTDGIYFDTFSYAYWTNYGRWTYSHWDKHSIDIDQKTWTIDKKKADLAIIVSDAQIKLVEKILKSGGVAIANHTLFTKKQCSLLETMMTFTERQGPLIAERHLSHPTVLGSYPGYKMHEKWDTAADMLKNILNNLDWGCLTYIYWPSKAPIAGNNIYKRMYPIKVKNIYAGCVEGENKIITKNSGRYTFWDTSIPHVYIYDVNGVESIADANQAKFNQENNHIIIELRVPDGGAAVIERASSLINCLERELDCK